MTQWLTPKVTWQRSGLRLHPILDMLGVRYVIFRGSPPAALQPDFAGPDYWVMTNGNALPRVYVPWKVETIEDDQERLAKLGDPAFNPAYVAYVEQKIDRLPCAKAGRKSLTKFPPGRPFR